MAAATDGTLSAAATAAHVTGPPALKVEISSLGGPATMESRSYDPNTPESCIEDKATIPLAGCWVVPVGDPR